MNQSVNQSVNIVGQSFLTSHGNEDILCAICGGHIPRHLPEIFCTSLSQDYTPEEWDHHKLRNRTEKGKTENQK